MIDQSPGRKNNPTFQQRCMMSGRAIGNGKRRCVPPWRKDDATTWWTCHCLNAVAITQEPSNQKRDRIQKGRTKLLCLKVDLNGRSHCTLDVNLPNVLPLLLEEGCQKVSCQLNVGKYLFFFHRNISNSDIQAHNLLHLKFDGGLDLYECNLQ